MAHMDESLEKEYGEHIEFNISYWKVDNGGSPKVSCILHKKQTKKTIKSCKQTFIPFLQEDQCKADQRFFLFLQVESIITNRKNEPFPELELEQNYCFQVEYLLYNKPYGNASKERCEFIPETRESYSLIYYLILFYLLLEHRLHQLHSECVCVIKPNQKFINFQILK